MPQRASDITGRVFSGLGLRALWRAWCAVNMKRGVSPPGAGAARRKGASGARREGPVLLLLTLVGLGAGGQEGPATPDPGPRRTLPAPADVVRSYEAVRGWVCEFQTPSHDEPAARLPIEGGGGVCVLLRRSGRVVGVGTDVSGDALMVRRAAGRALSQLLGDAAVAGLPAEMRPQLGSELTVELEVAGPLVPVLGRTFAQIVEQMEPGLDGVAMRRGDDWAVLFPAQMRATNTAGNLKRRLPGLAVQVGLTPQGLPSLARAHGVAMYSFRTIHLAQRGPGQAPFESFRGSVIVPESAVTRRALVELADGIAEHLLSTVWPDERPAGVAGAYRKPLGVMGDYDPVADQYRPPVAPPLEQALVSWALSRYHRTPGVDAATAQSAGSAAVRMLLDLAANARTEQEVPASPDACAAIVYAILERPEVSSDADLVRVLQMATQRMVDAYQDGRGFLAPPAAGGDAEPLGGHGQALVAAALGRLLVEAPGGVDPAFVRIAIDTAWQSVPPHRTVALLPWIGWAEVDFAGASGRPLANGESLRLIRRLLDESRIGSASRPGPPDLHGGFALRGGTGSSRQATAQTLRPAAYLARSLRDPRLTDPQEVSLALGRHLRTMRFVMQLAVNESSVWSIRNPERALGGIRAAPWDTDQPVAAQALGLVTATETILSLEGISGADRNR